MYSSKIICNEFKKNVKDQIYDIPVTDLLSAWQNGLANKTKFYEKLFKDVASRMGHEIEYERFRCDSTIVDKNKFPLVLIETENKHTTATTEVHQLCGIVSPVKALVLSCEWADSEREKWLPKWQEIIRTYNSTFPINSRFCIIISEWGRKITNDEILRFYFISLDSNGEIIDDLEWEIESSVFYAL